MWKRVFIRFLYCQKSRYKYNQPLGLSMIELLQKKSTIVGKHDIFMMKKLRGVKSKTGNPRYTQLKFIFFFVFPSLK